VYPPRHPSSRVRNLGLAAGIRIRFSDDKSGWRRSAARPRWGISVLPRRCCPETKMMAPRDSCSPPPPCEAPNIPVESWDRRSQDRNHHASRIRSTCPDKHRGCFQRGNDTQPCALQFRASESSASAARRPLPSSKTRTDAFLPDVVVGPLPGVPNRTCTPSAEALVPRSPPAPRQQCNAFKCCSRRDLPPPFRL